VKFDEISEPKGQVLTKICHYSQIGVRTLRCDVRDGQRGAGPSQGPRSSETVNIQHSTLTVTEVTRAPKYLDVGR
jgi:hypothetical protein